MRWLSERPSLIEYCELHPQFAFNQKCDYCGSGRQLPSLEMVMPNNLKFGLITNSFDRYLHFKSYICSQCGCDLYRDSYVE